MNLLLYSTLSRRTTSTISKLSVKASSKHASLLRDHCNFSKLKRKAKCRPRNNLKLSIAVLCWTMIAIIYLLCGKRMKKLTSKWRRAAGTGARSILEKNIYDDYNHIIFDNDHLDHNIYSNTFDSPDLNNRKQIIYTNIGIIIPSYFNQYTLRYLDRILHNIYLSQIDFEPKKKRMNGSNRNVNNIYFPSEVIISMSITPEHYPQILNITTTLQYYIDTFLQHNSRRLRIFYHYNTSMNAAQNRNYGQSQINYDITEYVGFFDMDDIMHPQRIAILYFILNSDANNKRNIDFLFHSYIMHGECKKKNIAHNYLTHFNSAKAVFLSDADLGYLGYDIMQQDANEIYETDYCVAYYRHKRVEGVDIFRVECVNELLKRAKIRNKLEFEEIFKFDRYYNVYLGQMAFINYSQLIRVRCENINNMEVKHPIEGALFNVSCDYGTMAGGLESFRNEKAVTRHHNGWPTMKASFAKKLKYDENWRLHGSYRGQDSGFNTDAFHEGANIFHVGAYLGMYCH